MISLFLTRVLPCENLVSFLVLPSLNSKQNRTIFLVFINCSGFIKIDTTEMGDSGPDIYIEVLDGSRIHPEHYPWARKMAVDAMCNEDDDVSTCPKF